MKKVIHAFQPTLSWNCFSFGRNLSKIYFIPVVNAWLLFFLIVKRINKFRRADLFPFVQILVFFGQSYSKKVFIFPAKNIFPAIETLCVLIGWRGCGQQEVVFGSVPWRGFNGSWCSKEQLPGIIVPLNYPLFYLKVEIHHSFIGIHIKKRALSSVFIATELIARGDHIILDTKMIYGGREGAGVVTKSLKRRDYISHNAMPHSSSSSSSSSPVYWPECADQVVEVRGHVGHGQTQRTHDVPQAGQRTHTHTHH